MKWPAGNSYMIYPGGEPSIRFDKMREGTIDYKKIKNLKKKAAASERYSKKKRPP